MLSQNKLFSIASSHFKKVLRIFIINLSLSPEFVKITKKSVTYTGLIVKYIGNTRNLKGINNHYTIIVEVIRLINIKKIGENIRIERKRQLLTIEKLAEKSGITENFLGKIERGEGTPSLETIDNIAGALDVGIDFLRGNYQHSKEYQFISSLMEINNLSEENKERFVDFISNNIKYFK